MTENEKVMSQRERLLARDGFKSSDRTYDTDEDVYAKVNEDYDNYDNQISRYKKNEDDLISMFSADPNAASLFVALRDGSKSFISKLFELYGPEVREALDDPEVMEEIAEGSKKYLQRVADSKKYEEEAAKNLKKSMADFDAYVESKGLSDEEAEKLWETYWQVVDDGTVHIMQAPILDMISKGLNYDSDVEQAEIAGEVRGRNTKIEEKLRKGKRGDGMADLGSRNVGTTARDMPEFGALSKYDNTQNIWERGGERRKSYK